MENAINGLLAVSIIKLVLDFLTNMQTKRALDDLRREFGSIQGKVIEACTILKERRAK